MSTNDPRIPTRGDVRSTIGFVQGADGVAQINSFKPHILSCDTLYVRDTAYVYGNLNANMNLTGVKFDNGSANAPSITFTLDPTTGIYNAGSSVGITASGVQQMAVGPSSVVIISPTVLDSSLSVAGQITTPSMQNLVINPSGSSIDFMGHTLINVGGISQNANRYDVIAPSSVTTIGTQSTTIFSIPTTTGAAYTLVIDLSFVSETDNTSTGAITITIKAKNIGGVVSTANPQIYTSVDTPLIGSTAIVQGNGTNINIVATGIVGQTINWFGAATVTRQVF